MLTLRIELSMVTEWLTANNLSVNTSKTEYVIFGQNNQLILDLDYDLNINGSKFERV